MCIPKLYFFFFFCVTIALRAQDTTTYAIATIAFYNLENLFDIQNDPLTYDDEHTPKGKNHWTAVQYQHKIKNMVRVLSEIGTPLVPEPPVLIGLAEVENKTVLQDIISDTVLAPYQYDKVHFESPDRRGIDVGLLYQTQRFKLFSSSAHPVYLYDTEFPEKRIYTRDLLLVSGWLDGELLHVFVNHWPSRSGGTLKSNYKRIQAAARQRQLIDSLLHQDPYAKIVVMGDFNDDPNNPSIATVLNATSDKEKLAPSQLYNPMGIMAQRGLGSLAWQDQWNLFDQIMLSKTMINPSFTNYALYTAGIFNPQYLTQSYGKYKGYPFRSFSNGHYTGGFSDHFPVYIHLIKRLTVTSVK